MHDNCGELRDPIKLLIREAGQDIEGNATETWRECASLMSQARDLSGREFFAASVHQMENVMAFKIRWRAGVNTGMHVLYQGQEYDIIQVDHLGNRRRGYMLLRARMIKEEGGSYGNL